jgi:hypothetical protein
LKDDRIYQNVARAIEALKVNNSEAAKDILNETKTAVITRSRGPLFKIEKIKSYIGMYLAVVNALEKGGYQPQVILQQLQKAQKFMEAAEKEHQESFYPKQQGQPTTLAVGPGSR